MKPLLLAAWLLRAHTVFAAPADTIPLDDKLKHGTLANGLNYYIYPNQTPKQKAELRLVVKAGSINENDNQRGLAHFLEHMAFNGTTHFPKQSLIDQLQRLGVEFGADLNAYTNSNETVYILPIPLNRTENLNTGLQVLEDWAFHMTLDEAQINQERHVIEEEWRLSAQNPESVTRDKNLDVLLKGSRYPLRKPIGQINVVRTAPAQLLQDFYRDWYRPDLMSVIVVGDVDVAKTRALIESHFANVQNPTPSKTMPDTQVTNNPEPLIGIFANKELPHSDVTIIQKDSADNHIDQNLNDYLTNQQHLLINAMINERLAAIQDQANPPFVQAYSGIGALGEARSKRAYTIYAQAMSGQEAQALRALHEQNQRVAQYGFTQDELDRAVRNQLASIGSSFNNRDKIESAEKADEYIRGFVAHEPLPSITWENDTLQKYLPRISLEQINQLARSYFTPHNRIVLINSNQTQANINQAQVLDVINSTKASQAPQAQLTQQNLLPVSPKAGTIVSTSIDKPLGLTTWQLSNGVRVSYKNTTFNDDKISFTAYSDGGTSLISNYIWQKTQWAYDGLGEAGLNGLSKTQLTRLLAGRMVNIQQEINQDSQGLSGEFSSKDATSAFELMYSHITGLNKDQAAFNRFVQRGKSSTQNLENDRMSAFMDYVMRHINRNNPRFSGSYPNAQAWQNLDYEAAFQARQQLFQNANGMHFIFVGKIDAQKLKPLVQTYLASLPSDLSVKPQFKDLGYRSDISGERLEFKKGKENLSIVYMGLNGQAPYNAQEALALRALGEILTIKLTEHLREVDGGVYSINASGEMHARPYGEYSLSISFPCAPDKVQSLTQSAQSELNQLIEKGPSEIDVEKFKKAALLRSQEQLNTNEYWVSVLQAAYKRNINPQEILNEQSRIQQLSAAGIQAIGQKYLNKPIGIVVLKPE